MKSRKLVCTELLPLSSSRRDTDVTLVSDLWKNWSPNDYHEFVWNNQNFVLYLGFLVMKQSCRERNSYALRRIHAWLWRKQRKTARAEYAGWVGSIVYLIWNIFGDDSAVNARQYFLQKLARKFPKLQGFTMGLDHESEGEDELDGSDVSDNESDVEDSN